MAAALTSSVIKGIIEMFPHEETEELYFRAGIQYVKFKGCTLEFSIVSEGFTYEVEVKLFGSSHGIICSNSQHLSDAITAWLRGRLN